MASQRHPASDRTVLQRQEQPDTLRIQICAEAVDRRPDLGRAHRREREAGSAPCVCHLDPALDELISEGGRQVGGPDELPERDVAHRRR